MYVKSLKTLCPWFFALNHHLYARWASVHIRDIEILEDSGSELVEEFARGNFVVTKSQNRFSAIAMDQNHEQCNATLKGRGGTLGLFQKDEALRRWLVTRPKLLELTRDFHEEVGISNDKLSWLHHEEGKSFQDRFREELDCLVQAFEDRGNPFEEKSKQLVTVCTREVADDEGVKQLLQLRHTAASKYESFVSSVFVNAAKSFWEPITKSPLDLFGKTRRSENNNKPSTALAKNNASLLQKVFISSYIRGTETLKLFFKHETEPYPSSLSCNGCIRSTTKSALLPILEKFGPSVLQLPATDTYIIDGSALIQMLRPEGDIATFEEYISKIVTPYVLRKAPFYKRVDIVFDVYLKNSIKGSTREKRGIGYRVEVSNQAFLPSQCSWSNFLRKGENKSTLFRMIANALITSITADIVTIVVTAGDVALCNTDLLDVSDISPCDHEEADTRMFLHVLHAQSNAIIKTVDTDVVIIAIFCFKDLGIDQLWIEFGCGSRTRFIPIHQIVSTMPHCDSISPCLPLFHALTGCDTVSSMLGIGKKKAWACWMRNVEKFCQMFSSLNFTSSFASISKLQHFVMALYTKKHVAIATNDIDECRYQLYASGISFDKLPPTYSALNQHTRRAMYQAEVWRKCLTKKQNVPSPLNWGWELSEIGELKPIWTTKEPVTSVKTLTFCCHCKSACSFRCACKNKSIKCTSLCSCKYEDCNPLDDRSKTKASEPSLSQRNVFDFLETLQ